MASRNNFISGITELLILSLLSQNDKYVYEISKDIENLSDGLLKISQNTLYSATYKLEKDGYISEYSKKVGRKRVRVYYKIERSIWEKFVKIMRVFFMEWKIFSTR